MDVIEGLTYEDERVLHDLCLIELGRLEKNPSARLTYGKRVVAVAVKLQRSMDGRQERGNDLIGSIVSEADPHGRTHDAATRRLGEPITETHPEEAK